MTLLTIGQGLAYNVGMDRPTVIAGSGDREHQELVKFANQTGEELARRVDWGQLQNTVTLTGSGAAGAVQLPAEFSRITSGIGVLSDDNIVRPLTRAEWGALTPVVGTPRYFLLEGSEITLWPFLASGATVTVSTQEATWCSNGTNEFQSDAETSLIDEELFLKGLIVRWRRQKGMPYEDQEAEYEAALQNFATFDDRTRI